MKNVCSSCCSVTPSPTLAECLLHNLWSVIINLQEIEHTATKQTIYCLWFEEEELSQHPRMWFSFKYKLYLVQSLPPLERYIDWFSHNWFLYFLYWSKSNFWPCAIEHFKLFRFSNDTMAWYNDAETYVYTNGFTQWYFMFQLDL